MIRVYGEREKTVAKSRFFATRKIIFAFAWRKIAKVVCEYPLKSQIVYEVAKNQNLKFRFGFHLIDDESN
jgi:hypothetical protein